MAYLAGVDLGTSSLKVIVMDEDGAVQAEYAKAYQFASPVNGYGEQDIAVWWRACAECLRLAARRVGAANIAGIGFSGQMHGAVFLDAHLCQVRPAILHLDTRSGRQLEYMKTLLSPAVIRGVLMNPLYSGFLLPSLLWVRENEPENYRRIRHVLLPKDYLRYRLCGEVHSDYSDASATLAFDIRRMTWAEGVLDTLGIDRSLFPACMAADAVAGKVTAAASAQTGLLEGTPVVAGGGDQVMQSIGSGVIAPGQATVNIGTSAQVSFQADHAIENPLLNTNSFCGYGKNRWYTMGATMSAGLSVKWIAELLGTGFQQLDLDIEAEAPGSGGLLFFPYLTGERTPHLNPDISGMLWGMSVNTSRSQMARAVMEGVAYSLRECMELCRSLGLSADTFVASGGGARSVQWLQIQADVYGVPLQVASVDQHAAVGAAIAAGSGINVYRSVADGCGRAVKYREKLFQPDPERHEVYTQYYQLYRQAFRDGCRTLQQLTALGRESRRVPAKTS